MQRIIITGGPGSGKTSIIEDLRRRGFHCVDEVGRQIIREQVRIGGDGVHWGDRAKFLELMLSRSIADYKRVAGRSGPVFFDRGIPELIGYCRLVGLPVPTHVRNAAALYRYGQPVFITPPWAAIYRNDVERKQSFEEAVATYRTVTAACIEAGYPLVEVPMDRVAKRADFILARIGLGKAQQNSSE